MDHQGRVCYGQMCVQSRQELELNLRTQNKALLGALAPSNFFTNINSFLIKNQSIGEQDRVFFFDSLAIILQSGIDILGGLALVQSYVKNWRLRDILCNVRQDLIAGVSFSQALSKHSSLCTPFMIHVINVGQHSGNIANVLSYLAGYLKQRALLKQEVQRALFLPALTIVFALCMVTGIVLFLVPQLESLFISLEKELPQATKMLINTSAFLRSYTGLLFILGLLGLCGGLYVLSKRVLGMHKDRLLLYIPFIKRLIVLNAVMHFIRTLNLLLSAGISLHDALKLVLGVVDNRVIKKDFVIIHELVGQGTSFSQALAQANVGLQVQPLVALIGIGEQTGQLSIMLDQAARIFEHELHHKLSLVTTILQPLLIALIGILIALLLWVLYMPIFNLAYSFQT